MYSNDSEFKTDRLSHFKYLSAIVLSTALAYANVLHGDFVFQIDDSVFMPLQSFRDIDLWSSFKAGTRPVATFTFSLNNYLWGRESFSYHLTNVIIHMLNGMLVYIFIYMTLTLNYSRPSKAPLCNLRLPLFGKDGIRHSEIFFVKCPSPPLSKEGFFVRLFLF